MNGNNQQKKRQPDAIAYTKTYTYPDAIIRVHFPDISDEENERRMKRIKKSAAELVKEKIKLERKRKERENEKTKQQ